MGLCVGGIDSIIRLNQGEGCARMVKKVGNLLKGHSGEKARCWCIIRIRRRTSSTSKASGVGDECGCGVWEDEEVKRLTVYARLLMCINRACKLTADDGADDVRIGCSANGRVVMLSSSIITRETGERAAVDIDGETSEKYTAGGQCGWI